MLSELEVRSFIEAEYSCESATLKMIRSRIGEGGFEHEELFPSQVGFLQWICKLKGVTSILEIGTFLGYSTVGFAEVLKESGGKITTIEIDAQRSAAAKANVTDGGLLDHVEFIVGDDLDSCTTLCEQRAKFDLVFLDTAETNYPVLYPICRQLLNKGGILIIDNVLMPTADGWVNGHNIIDNKEDATLSALAATLSAVQKDPGMDPVVLPLGSGILLSQRNGLNH